MSNRKPSIRNITTHDISEILETYNKYRFSYLETYKTHALSEHSAIAKAFPNISFRSTYRIKSYDSTLEKAYERELKDTYDIHGGRHIIREVDGIQTEDILIEHCYKIMEFLLNEYYPKNNILPIEGTFKDYIKTPKENGYAAIHISCLEEDRKFETQIKTEKMSEVAQIGRASHSSNYKPRFPGKYALTKLPFYIIPTTDVNGCTYIYEPNFEETFCHYYGMTYDEYLKKYEN